jgi:hypothetical protein
MKTQMFPCNILKGITSNYVLVDWMTFENTRLIFNTTVSFCVSMNVNSVYSMTLTTQKKTRETERERRTSEQQTHIDR